MAKQWKLSFSQGVVMIILLLSVGLVYLSLVYHPEQRQHEAKLQAIETQVQQLRGTFQSATPRETIMELKARVENLSHQLSSLEGAQTKAASSADAALHIAENAISTANDMQNKLMAFQEAINAVEKSYSGLGRTNTEEHTQLRDTLNNLLQVLHNLKDEYRTNIEAQKDQQLAFVREQSESHKVFVEKQEVNERFQHLEARFDERFRKATKIRDEPEAQQHGAQPVVSQPLAVKQVQNTQQQAELQSVKGPVGEVVVQALPLTHTVHNLGMHTVLLVICHDRPDYLERTLKGLLKYHPLDAIPIVISQDGNQEGVRTVIQTFEKKLREQRPTVPVVRLEHQQTGHQLNGYQKLAAHYKFALDTIFEGLPEVKNAGITDVREVIILEDDLDIALDFYSFFDALAPILQHDESLLAVSAWNDNGMRGFVKDEKILYRSDFFPGLGWMIPRRIWSELSPKWPRGYWDDWLREPQQRNGRHIIRPEVCRTFHFGIKGTSNDEYSQFLRNIQLNENYVDFSSLDLSYLEHVGRRHMLVNACDARMQSKWRSLYVDYVNELPVTTLDEFFTREVKIQYRAPFETIARRFGIMDNVKAGVPRTAFEGIVSFWTNDKKVHLVPVE